MPSLQRDALQREPAVLDETALRQMMRDPRYWHPTSRDPAYQREVEAGFRRLYPGPARRDATGRQHRPWDDLTDRPRPTADGPVHVDAYGRQRDGQREQVRQHYRARPGDGGGHRALPPPDQVPRSPQDLYRRLDFDPEGLGEKATAALYPREAIWTRNYLAPEALQVTKQQFPNHERWNDEADAFRHAYWSYRMTQYFGAAVAKKIGDAHERSGDNLPGERMMDLYNNDVGRSLAQVPENRDRDPREVIGDAMRQGLLRLSPY